MDHFEKRLEANENEVEAALEYINDMRLTEEERTNLYLGRLNFRQNAEGAQ